MKTAHKKDRGVRAPVICGGKDWESYPAKALFRFSSIFSRKPMVVSQA